MRSRKFILIIVISSLVIVLSYGINLAIRSMLQTQAIEKFSSQSEQVYTSLAKDFNNIARSSENIVEWISGFNNLQLASTLHLETVARLTDDNDTLIHGMGILRPDTSIVWLMMEDPSRPSFHRRGIKLIGEFDFDSAIFDVQNEPTWMHLESSVLADDNSKTLYYIIPYEHETGSGLVWFEIPESALDVRVSELNSSIEFANSYTLIINEDGFTIVFAGLETSNSELDEAIETLLDSYAQSEISDVGLYEFADPFNGDEAGYFRVDVLQQTNWLVVSALPKSEIDTVGQAMQWVVMLTALLGIVISAYLINRFLAN